MKLAGKTDVGVVRQENQDNYRAAQLSDGMVWALVCDGMGGARGGKMASGMACEAIERYFNAELAHCESGDERAFLVRALEQANAEVYQKSRQEVQYSGMGTTAVAVLVRGGTAHICHVGDSRGYLYRGGRLTQLTHDHSYVQELVDNGTITPKEAENHPRKNVITRALGVEYRVEPEYTCATVTAGDILLLCTDGLTNAVAKLRIERILADTSLYRAVGALIDAANSSGGPDNITALLVGLDTEDENG